MRIVVQDGDGRSVDVETSDEEVFPAMVVATIDQVVVRIDAVVAGGVASFVTRGSIRVEPNAAADKPMWELFAEGPDTAFEQAEPGSQAVS